MKNRTTALAVMFLLSMGQHALAAPLVPLGDPFQVQQGESVELAQGVNQVRESDVHLLPCEATLLESAGRSRACSSSLPQ